MYFPSFQKKNLTQNQKTKLSQKAVSIQTQAQIGVQGLASVQENFINTLRHARNNKDHDSLHFKSNSFVTLIALKAHFEEYGASLPADTRNQFVQELQKERELSDLGYLAATDALELYTNGHIELNSDKYLNPNAEFNQNNFGQQMAAIQNAQNKINDQQKEVYQGQRRACDMDIYIGDDHTRSEYEYRNKITHQQMQNVNIPKFLYNIMTDDGYFQIYLPVLLKGTVNYTFDNEYGTFKYKSKMDGTRTFYWDDLQSHQNADQVQFIFEYLYNNPKGTLIHAKASF